MTSRALHLSQVPDNELETVGCGLCGETSFDTLFQVRGFTIVRCRGCHLRYVSPRLKASRLLDLYAHQDYFQSDRSLLHGYRDYASDRENIWATCRRRWTWILSNIRRRDPGRLLDMGCALGYTVEYAIQQGWDAFGLEPSTYAAQIAQNRLGSRILNATLETSHFPSGHFNTILMWDVIEHVPDPVDALRQAAALLAPGGTLSIITPDCGSLLARIMGRGWMEYAKPTEHIYIFSRQTLRTAVQRAGFQVIGLTTAGKVVSLEFLLDRCADLFTAFSFLKTPKSRRWLTKSVYIDPHDKMHCLVRKGEVP